MGRRKNANPQRKANNCGDTEQLGARASSAGDDASRLPVLEEHLEKKEESLPLPKKRRIITSDDEDNESFVARSVAINEARAQLDPEVTIESNDGENYWTIQLAHATSETMHNSCNREWTLREYRLLRTRLLSQDGVEVNSCSVYTSNGAAKLLQHCASSCSVDSAKDLTVIAEAVEDRTLHLDCLRESFDSTSVDVRISLTERAFDVCSADRLPLHRRASSIKYQSATQLHHALAALFPNSVVADVLHAQDTSPITAKTVYDLIDNVKLQEYEANGGYDSKPMSIPGLLPALRPYQEAAVKWMLKREQFPNSENNEWELAWIVLAEGPRQIDKETKESESGGLLLQDRELVSLPDWKRQMKRKEVKSGIIFSPFAGFLVKSVVDAYMATLNSFLISGDGSEWAITTGGILAESMGLGKTVEVGSHGQCSFVCFCVQFVKSY